MQKKTVGINITRRCNLKCPHCFYSELLEYPETKAYDSKIDIDVDKLINFFDFHKFKEIFLSGGEPTTYPRLLELLHYLSKKCEAINICTNGVNIPIEINNFSKNNNVKYLISVRNDSDKMFFSKILSIINQGIKVELYHVLNENSTKVLKNILILGNKIKKLRLLYSTSSKNNNYAMYNFNEWNALLKNAYKILFPIIEKVEVEIAFVPVDIIIKNESNRGAVPRYFIDMDLKVYSCPLLVENKNGKHILENFPEECDSKKCPIFSKTIEHPVGVKRICPFVLMKLENLLELEKKYRRNIYGDNY